MKAMEIPTATVGRIKQLPTVESLEQVAAYLSCNNYTHFSSSVMLRRRNVVNSMPNQTSSC